MVLILARFTKGPPSRVGRTKKISNKSFSPYMILVSKFFLVPIGCLQGAQEALDLPLAVAVTGSGLGPLGGLLGVQNHLPTHFYT